MKKSNNFYYWIINIQLQNEHNRQQADDWFWDIIETNLTVSFSSSWVLNSDSSAHLCTSQDLEEVRGLKQGEITL